MSRPNDHRGKIGAAFDSKDRDKRPKRDNSSRRGNDKRSPPPRRDSRPSERSDRSSRPAASERSVRVTNNTLKKCTVSDFTVRDGSLHESDNFYEFLQKLLVQVNNSLKKTVPEESYKVKEIRETLSPASKAEKRKFAGSVKSAENMLHCSSVIVGLPPCVFFGNGFSERQWNLAKMAAGKDMVEKIYRIGFISPRLYDFISNCRRFDHNLNLPDFTKAVNAFVSLEQHMTKHSWPWDVLTAPEQPIGVLDRLKSIFRLVLQEVHGRTGGDAPKDARSREEDEIERKIAIQREEMLRRERAREMVEPLDDGPIGAGAPSLSAPSIMPHPWNGPMMRQPLLMPPMPMGPGMMPPMMPMMGPGGMQMVPPMGAMPFMPQAAQPQPQQQQQRPVDMDIDEPSPHPYSKRREPSPLRERDRYGSPTRERYGRDSSPGRDRYRSSRDDDFRRSRDEEERLRRKEEELERKLKEEVERREREIENEVRRRLQEEMSKLKPEPAAPLSTTYSSLNTLNTLGGSGYQSSLLNTATTAGAYGTQGVYSTTQSSADAAYDHEMEEIRRLVKETEDRLRELTEQESSMYNSGDTSTLRTLAALGETASGMTTYQKKDLITELRNLLGHSGTTTASSGNSRSIISSTGDRWRATTVNDIPIARAPRSDDRYVTTFHDKPRGYERRDRTRSRSPRRDRSPRPRSSNRDSYNDRDRRDSKQKTPCAFCESYSHLADMCHMYTTPATRKLELRKSGRCSVCLKKHGGKCEYPQTCEYCGHKTHHRTVCEHPDHIKKLSALRDLARAY